MLYVSTRNTKNTYTAHRALSESVAHDDGYFVPFYLPSFSFEEICNFRKESPYKTIAKLLNLFFSSKLSSADIENTLGRDIFISKNLSQNLTIAELWHTPEGDCGYIYSQLNQLLTGKASSPTPMARIAIEISLLFSLLGTFPDHFSNYDITLTADNLSNVVAILYAKKMGFPIKNMICACDDDSSLWDLMNKNSCSTVNIPEYFEILLYVIGGHHLVEKYLEAYIDHKTYYIDEEVLQSFNDSIYPCVVSRDRADSIISGFFRSNQYVFDIDSALAYGGLQDYRAIIGANNQTVICSRKRPERIKE